MVARPDGPAPLIRPARNADIARLAAVGLAAWQAGIGPLVPPYVAARVVAADPFRPFLEHCRDQVLVALIDDRPAGFGATELGDDCISDLWVDPAYAGRGCGGALLAALMARTAGRGHGVVRLEVMAGNDPARRLYERAGFAVARQFRAYDPVLGVSIDKLAMTCPLTADVTLG